MTCSLSSDPILSYGMGDLEKYNAKPFLSNTTLTTFGSWISAAFVILWHSVAITIAPSFKIGPAASSIIEGCRSGSSAWIFTIILASIEAAISVRRSEPLLCAVDVYTTFAPNPFAAL